MTEFVTGGVRGLVPGLSPGIAPSAVEPTRTPRFSVRFAAGQAELVLLQPLAFEGGVLHSLVMGAGPAPRVTDFSRGWRALANRRTTLLSVDGVLDPTRLGLSASREGGWWLASTARDRLLVERERPWGHVALELGPAIDGARLLLVPLAARSFSAGPGAPIAELEDVVRALVRANAREGEAPRLDASRGAIDLGDVLQRMLTEALIPHGLRVPELGVLSRQVSVTSAGLRLSAGSEASPDLEQAARRELGRRIAPLLVRACANAAPSELAPLLASDLPPEIRAAFGGSEDELTSLRLALEGTRRASFAEISAWALRVDAGEPAPGVATDALLATLSRASVASGDRASGDRASGDLPRARELLARAFSRSPSRPEVLAASLELAAGAADPRLSREVLRDVERGQRERGQRVDPWLDVALARAEEQLGEQDAAFERWERAARSPLTLPETFEGLAKQLVRRGRSADALLAFERAAELYDKGERRSASARAKLAAARITLAMREPHAAVARVQALVASVPDEDVALLVELRAFEARAYRECGEGARAERAEVALAQLVDRAGAEAPEAAVTALLEAARTMLFESEDGGPRADALLEVVMRVRPNDPRIEELRRAELANAQMRIEAPTQRAGDRSALARVMADGFRARSRPADAARILLRAGELDRDLTLLRVAIDLAEQTGDAALVDDVIRRTLEVVGEGPARAALEARLSR